MTILHLHLARRQRSPLAPDAAARLSSADCAAIAGDDEAFMERNVTGLICVFLSPISFFIGEWLMMLIGWAAT